MLTGFAMTAPSLVFWCLVVYSRIFHNPRYVDAVLSFGGTFCGVLIKSIFPFASLGIAILCHMALQQEAIAKNIWHRDTPMMRLNQRLINWNAVLLLVMIFSLINN